MAKTAAHSIVRTSIAGPNLLVHGAIDEQGDIVTACASLARFPASIIAQLLDGKTVDRVIETGKGMSAGLLLSEEIRVTTSATRHIRQVLAIHFCLRWKFGQGRW